MSVRRGVRQALPVLAGALMVIHGAAYAVVESVSKTSAKADSAEVVKSLDISAEPHAVVESVTDALMKVVAQGKDELDQNPEKYFKDVRLIMEKAVDFQFIAKNVMGSKYWRSATEIQRTRFVEVFTSGLVETYAKGMANFADFEISVQEPDEEIGVKNKAEVVQKFKGPKGVNFVSYTMGRHKSGEWKLINVVLDGVNLGKTLRAQFSQSVKESEGDLDAAIDGWTWKA